MKLRVSLIVGFEAALAGVVGVASGSLAGQKLRKRYPTADAQVCAWSMVICAPLLYWGCCIATGPPVPLYTVLFFAQWFLNVSWFVIVFKLFSDISFILLQFCMIHFHLGFPLGTSSW